MTRIATLAISLGLVTTLHAQQVLFEETFEGASPAFTLNTNDQGSSSDGANTWVINAAYTGGSGTLDCLGFPFSFTVNNTAGQPGGVTAPNGNYLHILSVAAANSGIQNCCFAAADGFCTPAGNHFARMSTDVSTLGSANATLSFWWLCGGGTSNYGEVYYSTNGGSSWTLLSTPIAQYRNQPTWVQQTITLPALGGHAALRFGFRFVNGTTLTASDPGFGIDDVRISVPGAVTNSIVTGAVPDPVLCQGASVGVPYTANGTWSAGNVFTLQLSDATGSFAAPVAIGTLVSNSSGIVPGIIPMGTPPGTGYQFRVVASDPAAVGSAGTTTHQVVAPPSAGEDAALNVCANSGSYALLDVLAGDPATCGAWTRPDGQPFSGVLNSATDPAGVYTYTTNCPGGCPQDAATVSVTYQPAPNAGADVVTSTCSDAPPADLTEFVNGGSTDGAFFLNGTPATTLQLTQPGTYALAYVVPGAGGCPSDTASITVTVNAAPDAGESTSFTACINDDPVALFDLLVGAEEGGSWSGPGGAAFNGTLVPATGTSGLYTYTVPGIPPCEEAVAFVAVVIDPCAGVDERHAATTARWMGQWGDEQVFTGVPPDAQLALFGPNGQQVGFEVSDRQEGVVRIRSRHATAGLHLLQVVDDRSIQVVRLVHVAQ
jgi:hypothetical protein